MTNVGYHPNLVNLLGACTQDGLYHLYTLSLSNVAKGKFRPNFQISFSKIVRNKIASCESTGRELSFEWSHHRISSTDSKVRVTLQNSIKHSGGERVKMKKIQNNGF